MHLRGAFLLSGLVSVVLVSVSQGGDDKLPSPTPEQWIERLGSMEFRERQEAMRALDALGEAALPSLKLAQHGDDLEVRGRCQELIAIIELRRDSTRLIQPKRVHLIYKDTPLPEAIADFSRQAGCQVELGGDQAKLAGRKVTVDTGMVPFWDALEQFSIAAGLIEIGLSPTKETVAPKPGTPEYQLWQLQRQRQVMFQGNISYYGPNPTGFDPNRVVLVDGQMPNLPTYRAGSLRIRQLPSHVPVRATTAGDGEKTVPLEITPEPGLAWMGLLSVKVSKAIDEHGQALTQPTLFSGQPLVDSSNPYQVVQIWNGNVVYGNNLGRPLNPTHAPLQIKLGDKPAKVIKELQGTVTGQVQTPPEPLIVVDNILKAAGQTVPGSAGGSIQVNEVRREANGLVKIKVVVEPPSQDAWSGAPNGGLFGNIGRAVRINRAVMQLRGGVPVAVDPNTLELRDERGVPFKPQGGVQTAQQEMVIGAPVPQGAGMQELELSYMPQPGQGAPARLVFIGRRAVTVEVAFTLKDLTLQ